MSRARREPPPDAGRRRGYSRLTTCSARPGQAVPQLPVGLLVRAQCLAETGPGPARSPRGCPRSAAWRMVVAKHLPLLRRKISGVQLVRGGGKLPLRGGTAFAERSARRPRPDLVLPLLLKPVRDLGHLELGRASTEVEDSLAGFLVVAVPSFGRVGVGPDQVVSWETGSVGVALPRPRPGEDLVCLVPASLAVGEAPSGRRMAAWDQPVHLDRVAAHVPGPTFAPRLA